MSALPRLLRAFGHRDPSEVTVKVVDMTNDVAVYRRARPDEEPDALFYPGHRGKPHAGLLNGPGPDGPRTVEEFYGGATLALWRGVTPGAVTKWFSRHPGRMPAEDARLLNADGTGYERYYRASREAEWREVAPGPGRGAPGKPKPRGAEADARRGAAWLDSTEPGQASKDPHPRRRRTPAAARCGAVRAAQDGAGRPRCRTGQDRPVRQRRPCGDVAVGSRPGGSRRGSGGHARAWVRTAHLDTLKARLPGSRAFVLSPVIRELPGVRPVSPVAWLVLLGVPRLFRRVALK